MRLFGLGPDISSLLDCFELVSYRLEYIVHLDHQLNEWKKLNKLQRIFMLACSVTRFNVPLVKKSIIRHQLWSDLTCDIVNAVNAVASQLFMAEKARLAVLALCSSL